MKYLIEATAGKDGEFDDVAIPMEIIVDGEWGNTSVIFTLEGKDYWIPVSELSHLMYNIEGLVE